MNPVIFNFLFQFLQEQLLQNGKEEDISTITLKGNLPSTERVVLATFTVDEIFPDSKIIPDLLHLGLPNLRAFACPSVNPKKIHSDIKDSPKIPKSKSGSG